MDEELLKAIFGSLGTVPQASGGKDTSAIFSQMMQNAQFLETKRQNKQLQEGLMTFISQFAKGQEQGTGEKAQDTTVQGQNSTEGILGLDQLLTNAFFEELVRGRVGLPEDPQFAGTEESGPIRRNR